MGLDSLLALVCAGVVMASGADKQDANVTPTMYKTAPSPRRWRCKQRCSAAANVCARETTRAKSRRWRVKSPSSTAALSISRNCSGPTRAMSRSCGWPVAKPTPRSILARLLIIDRDASKDIGATARPGPVHQARPGPIPVVENKPNPTIRLQRDEESREPESIVGVRKNTPDVADLLTRADQEFSQKHFDQAGRLYEQANAIDPNSATVSRERLAYCKLYRVVEELNKPSVKPQLVELEKEARVALSLAPRLEFGKKVLAEIQQRKTPASAPGNRSENQVVVRQRERNAEGWLSCETSGFIIYHRESSEVASAGGSDSRDRSDYHAAEMVWRRCTRLDSQMRDLLAPDGERLFACHGPVQFARAFIDSHREWALYRSSHRSALRRHQHDDRNSAARDDAHRFGQRAGRATG